MSRKHRLASHGEEQLERRSSQGKFTIKDCHESSRMAASRQSAEELSAKRRQHKMCDRCKSLSAENLFLPLRSIDASQCFTDSNDLRFTQLVMDLGSLDKASSSSCSLCRLFFSVRIKLNEGTKASHYGLHCVKAPQPFLAGDRSVLAVVDVTSRTMDGGEGIQVDRRGSQNGFITCTRSPGLDGSSSWLQGRVITPDHLDFNILQHWIEDCEKMHKLCVKAPSATKLKSLKLIDCALRRIVEAPGHSRYAALSYVWGQTSFSIDTASPSRQLPAMLPQTIEDALTVTTQLGLSFIWIDRYCVSQVDEVGRDIQIGQMDLIYKNASVTIIAAAGDDPHYGLPGMSKTPRMSQPSASIEDERLVSIMAAPEVVVGSSTWMKRGWTYQESFSSRRQLIFTDQQVFFECLAGSAFETVATSSQSSETRLLGGVKNLEKSPWSIWECLGEFSARNLTYESDTLRAFEGIFRHYREQQPPVYQYLGIPIVPSFQETQTRELKVCQVSWSKRFTAGLCWRNSGPGQRRAQFPSWSWAGWTAQLMRQTPESYDGLGFDQHNPISIHVEDSNGCLSEFDQAYGTLPKTGISSTNYIHLDVWAIPLNIQWVAHTETWLEENPIWPKNASGYFAIFEDLSFTAQVVVYLLPHTEGKSETIVGSRPFIEEHEIFGIILGPCEDFFKVAHDASIFMMVVQDHGEHVERIGHVILEKSLMRVIPGSFEEGNKFFMPWSLFFRSRYRRHIRLG